VPQRPRARSEEPPPRCLVGRFGGVRLWILSTHPADGVSALCTRRASLALAHGGRYSSQRKAHSHDLECVFHQAAAFRESRLT